MSTTAEPRHEKSRDAEKAAQFVELIRKKIEKLRPKLLDLTRRNLLQILSREATAALFESRACDWQDYGKPISLRFFAVLYIIPTAG